MAGQEYTRATVPSFMQFFAAIKGLPVLCAAFLTMGMASSDAMEFTIEADADSSGDTADSASDEDSSEHEHQFVIRYFSGRTKGGDWVTIYQCVCGAKQYNYYA